MKKIVIFGSIILVLGFLYLYFRAPHVDDVKLNFFESCNFDGARQDVLSFTSAGDNISYNVKIVDSLGNELINENTNTTLFTLDSLDLKEDEKITITISSLQNDKVIEKQGFEIPYGKTVNRSPMVKSNRDSGNVSGRKKIVLSTSSSKAAIYYTTDGSLPDKNSNVYEEPIELSESMILSTISYIEGMEPSYVSSFLYNVISTTPIIYLSPSTQEDNFGIKSAGYTTEEEIMNKVGDVVEQQLKDYGYIIYRNTPEMTAKSSAADSKALDVDLHLAIHSNASPNNSGRYHGIETYVYDESCFEAIEIAEILQKNLTSIYYRRDGNRGIRYSVDIGGLRETNPIYVNNGILVEVAFHDNYSDAKWIVENINSIGKSIANSVIEYFG